MYESILSDMGMTEQFFFVSVVLVTLAADSLEGVWPAYSATTYKIFSIFM